jgi:hypothetical protein
MIETYTPDQILEQLKTGQPFNFSIVTDLTTTKQPWGLLVIDKNVILQSSTPVEDFILSTTDQSNPIFIKATNGKGDSSYCSALQFLQGLPQNTKLQWKSSGPNHADFYVHV